jgi:hypothetical protein
LIQEKKQKKIKPPKQKFENATNQFFCSEIMFTIEVIDNADFSDTFLM